MAKAAKKTTKKSAKSAAPDEPEIEDVEEVEEEAEPEPEPQAPPETPPESSPPAEGAADEPIPPPAGSSAVTLRGKGTLSVMFDGEVHSLERGKKIKVPAGLAAALAGEIEEEK